MKLINFYFEKFLNEIIKHPILKSSLALEIFLTVETKKSFDKKCKEIKKFLNNFVLIDGNTSKKNFDYMINKNPIGIFPNYKNFIDVKISALLKKYYSCCDG